MANGFRRQDRDRHRSEPEDIAPGFLDEPAVIERYSCGSDRDLSGFGFYLGLAAFNLAAILEGIHYRYLHGQTDGGGFDRVGETIHPLLDGDLTH